MAGAGVRLFTAGSILTAQQVNEFLMDQTVCRFADAAARDAAFGGVGEPVLSEGRICYLDSDNNIYVYNGTSWVEIQSGITGTAGQVVVYNSSGDPVAQTVTGDVTISSTGVTSIGTGVIVNADVSNSAAIAHSKLANITAGSVLLGNATNVPTATALSGDVTVNSSGVTAIGSGVIVNADINASAAIAHSKLANITAGSVLIGNPSNVPTATALSGDVTVTSSGVTAIGSGVIVNADINASAAIDKTKISGTAITAADTGTVTSTMIADGTIVNADINASAAISHSKLANITAGQVLLGNGSNVPTATALSGDVTVNSTGVTAIASGVIVDADISSTAAIERGKIADLSIDTKIANYSLVLGDKNKVIEMNVGSANTVTVPLNSAHAFPIGSQVTVTQYGAGKTQVVATGGVTVRATPGAYLRAQYSTATLIKRGTDEWYLIGDLSAS
jgi:hypothetical protein